jgi:hypothetical protein
MSLSKITASLTLAYPEIATHAHFVSLVKGSLLPQTAPVLQFHAGAETIADLLSGVLNSSSVLFWLKQMSFNKGAGKDEQLDRFEYQGKRIKQVPIPRAISETLRGKSNRLSETLSGLARECRERGRELPMLTLRNLFEKPNEAYHASNASLPGHVAAHKGLGAPFSSTKELEACFARACEIREKLRQEMIARQEEMDWLVYTGYGLIDETHPAAARLTLESDLTLDRDERPFRFWAKAGCDFDKAVAIMPAEWSAAKKRLWRARLETIRDNEHVRRIEQPVCKRRWDEQWKIGNRWECGPAAYAQELMDGFYWWLSEKSEWYLEHKANGGPIKLATWSAALFKDARVAAAWPVVAKAIFEVKQHKFRLLGPEKTETKRPPKLDDTYSAFEHFFRELVTEQSVPHGLPPAKPWNELAEKKRWTPAQLNKAKAVRGKLNVPRERFQIGSAGEYLWAGTNS